MSEQRIVNGTIDLTLNLSDRRGIKITTYILDGETPAETNAKIDQIQDYLDRQQIRADIVNKEAQVAQLKSNLESIADLYEQIIKHRDSGKKLTSTEKQQLDNHGRAVEQANKNIASLQAAIREGKSRLSLTART